MSMLDAVMPEWDWCETYGAWLPASPHDAVAAMRQVPPEDIRFLALLVEARNLPGRLGGRPRFRDAMQGSDPLYDQLLEFGFTSLGEKPDQVAFGMIDQSWKVSGGLRADVADVAAFGEFAEPGYVKIAADISARPVRDGAFVRTQTRVLATDRRSRRVFGAYWLLIRPFSGFTRRMWLEAAARRLAD